MSSPRTRWTWPWRSWASRSANPAWLLIDGSSLIFRAYYGVPATVKSPDGRPVNAVRGFLDMLARLISERRPGHLAVATDEDWRPQFRVDLLPSYKAHRTAEPVPPLLEPQMPIIWEVLDSIGLAVVRASGYEAEDVIASLVPRVEPPIEIVSGDRDLFALIRDPDVAVLYPEGMGRLTRFDEAEVTSRYGIPGRSYADFAILRGDPSDGLPGVRGVGAKSATNLVKRHGSVEAMVQAGVFQGEALAYVERARQVVRPVDTIPLKAPKGGLPQAPRDPDRLLELAERHGLASPATRLVNSLRSAA